MRINVRVSSIKGGVERTQPHSLLYSMCISFNQINFEPLAPRNLSIFVRLKFREMEWHSFDRGMKQGGKSFRVRTFLEQTLIPPILAMVVVFFGILTF